MLTGHGAVVTTKYEVTQRVQRTSLCRSAESPCASWQRSSVQDLDRIKRKCFLVLQRTNWRNEVRIYFPINLDFFILTPSPFLDSEKCIEIQKPFLGLNSSCCVWSGDAVLSQMVINNNLVCRDVPQPQSGFKVTLNERVKVSCCSHLFERMKQEGLPPLIWLDCQWQDASFFCFFLFPFGTSVCFACIGRVDWSRRCL